MTLSKRAQARKEQEYNPTPVPAVCGTCKHFSSEKVQVVEASQFHDAYFQEKEKRCAIGGFAVKKMGTCKLHEFA